MGIDFLMVRIKGVPCWDLLRARSQLSVGWNDSHGLLASKYFLAHFVPAHVELAFVLGDPLLGRMMGCVCGAWGVVRNPGLVGCDRVQHLNARDGVVGHILIEEIIRLVVR